MHPTVLLKGSVPFVVAIAIWLIPVPSCLTDPAWHLFAIFVAAIVSVLVGAYPLLTSTMLVVAAVVITSTISPAKAFGGFREDPAPYHQHERHCSDPLVAR